MVLLDFKRFASIVADPHHEPGPTRTFGAGPQNPVAIMPGRLQRETLDRAGNSRHGLARSRRRPCLSAVVARGMPSMGAVALADVHQESVRPAAVRPGFRFPIRRRATTDRGATTGHGRHCRSRMRSTDRRPSCRPCSSFRSFSIGERSAAPFGPESRRRDRRSCHPIARRHRATV